MLQVSPRAYRNYLLTVLTVILAFNYVDRLALGILLQDIKTDFGLSDTQLGLLTGIAFALFYSVMGIPIARWADRGNRVTIISTTAALWSMAVALCGATTSFVQLLLVRVAVAVGEAGCVPPAHSLISDYYDRAERPRALSRYLLGGSFALLVGYFMAGWLNELYGWRATFIILGLPGLLLAVLAGLTLKEPRRTTRAVRSSAQPSSLIEVFTTLWANPAFRHLLMGFSIFFFFGYGILQWQPAFFARSHALQTGELGTWFALVYGIGDALGVYLGGELAARYAAEKERLQLMAAALAFVVLTVVRIGAYLTPDYHWAFAALGVSVVVGAMAQGPLYATIQTLVPPRMRATAIAIIYLLANLIGMGLGPLAVGVISDALRPTLGEQSLRYALILLCPGYSWAAWHLWRASRTVARDLQSAQEREPSGAKAALLCGDMNV